jgi:hypothetical protein
MNERADNVKKTGETANKKKQEKVSPPPTEAQIPLAWVRCVEIGARLKS